MRGPSSARPREARRERSTHPSHASRVTRLTRSRARGRGRTAGGGGAGHGPGPFAFKARARGVPSHFSRDAGRAALSLTHTRRPDRRPYTASLSLHFYSPQTGRSPGPPTQKSPYHLGRRLFRVATPHTRSAGSFSHVTYSKISNNARPARYFSFQHPSGPYALARFLVLSSSRSFFRHKYNKNSPFYYLSQI